MSTTRQRQKEIIKSPATSFIVKTELGQYLKGQQTPEQMKYLVKIHWSDEDEAYIANVPALRGCVSHGDTIEEAAHNIGDAINLWLASARKNGDYIHIPDLATEEITRLAPILNVSKLARLSEINQNTLSSKLRRGSSFTPKEGERILEAIGGM